jgi:hypothetical protein
MHGKMASPVNGEKYGNCSSLNLLQKARMLCHLDKSSIGRSQQSWNQYEVRFPERAVHGVQQRQWMGNVGRLVANRRGDSLAPVRVNDKKSVSKKRLQGAAPLALR